MKYAMYQYGVHHGHQNFDNTDSEFLLLDVSTLNNDSKCPCALSAVGTILTLVAPHVPRVVDISGLAANSLHKPWKKVLLPSKNFQSGCKLPKGNMMEKRPSNFQFPHQFPFLRTPMTYASSNARATWDLSRELVHQNARSS